METSHYRFQLGRSECVSLWDGNADYTLESMVANISRSEVEGVLLAHGLPSDHITTPYTSLFVNTRTHRILVDAGGGTLFANTGNLLQSMNHVGIAPESIDAIFITHAHPDHIGGVTNEKGEPVFPRANYYVSRLESDFWFSQEALVKVGEWMTDIARAKLTPIKNKTILLDREEEILPGVSVVFAPGHTPGHIAVSFSDEGKRLLYTGDTVLHPLHLERPDWLPIFDILPEAAASSKRRIFDLAASVHCLVMGQQFPFPSVGYVTQNATAWIWHPLEMAH